VILTPAEIELITNRKRCDGQRNELDFMGIQYMVRRDGSLVVLRSHVESLGLAKPKEPPEPQMYFDDRPKRAKGPRMLARK